MAWFRLGVAKKIAAGYLLVTLFCLAAVVYALTALSNQTRLNQDLVTIDFTVMSLVRDLRGNLLAQERLERQTLILRDEELVALLGERQQEFHQLHERLEGVESGAPVESLAATMRDFEKPAVQGLDLLEGDRWEEATVFSEAVLSPLRNRLVGQLEHFIHRREQTLDQQLKTLLAQSRRAFSLTLMLAFVGTSLAGAVAAWGIYRIHQSVTRLTRATKEIAAGSFDFPIALDRPDEFGQLARDFQEMGQKLKELDRLRLDANPLTHLPGNLSIERELEKRIAAGTPFATMYVDLDHFKAYNDRYGYQAGSDVIAAVGTLIQQAVKEHGNPQDMVGHIGGDDYVVLSTPDRAETLAGHMVATFDRSVPQYYSEEDRAAGFFVSQDRFGVERRFPLLTVSIAVVTSDSLKNPSALAIGRECAKIKDHLKKLAGSNYLIDRREQR